MHAPLNFERIFGVILVQFCKWISHFENDMCLFCNFLEMEIADGMFYKSAHLWRVSREITLLSSRHYSLWKQHRELKRSLFLPESRDIFLFSRLRSDRWHRSPEYLAVIWKHEYIAVIWRHISIFIFVCSQTEIAKRLNAIIAQVLPFLAQEVSL